MYFIALSVVPSTTIFAILSHGSCMLNQHKVVALPVRLLLICICAGRTLISACFTPVWLLVKMFLPKQWKVSPSHSLSTVYNLTSHIPFHRSYSSTSLVSSKCGPNYCLVQVLIQVSPRDAMHGASVVITKLVFSVSSIDVHSSFPIAVLAYTFYTVIKWCAWQRVTESYLAFLSMSPCISLQISAANTVNPISGNLSPLGNLSNRKAVPHNLTQMMDMMRRYDNSSHSAVCGSVPLRWN